MANAWWRWRWRWQLRRKGAVVVWEATPMCCLFHFVPVAGSCRTPVEPTCNCSVHGAGCVWFAGRFADGINNSGARRWKQRYRRRSRVIRRDRHVRKQRRHTNRRHCRAVHGAGWVWFTGRFVDGINNSGARRWKQRYRRRRRVIRRDCHVGRQRRRTNRQRCRAVHGAGCVWFAGRFADGINNSGARRWKQRYRRHRCVIRRDRHVRRQRRHTDRRRCRAADENACARRGSCRRPVASSVGAEGRTELMISSVVG